MNLRLLILLLVLPCAARAQAPDTPMPPRPAASASAVDEPAEAIAATATQSGRDGARPSSSAESDDHQGWRDDLRVVRTGTAEAGGSQEWRDDLRVVRPGSAETDEAASDPATTVPGPNLAALFKSGGFLMWPILLCSVVMVAFALERAVSLRQAHIFPEALRRELMTLARNGEVAEATARCQAGRSPFARLMLACLQRADNDGFEMEAALEEAGARVLYDLRRNCKVLAVVADISPLLGLMGTVTGMIKAFDVVARSGALGRTELLAEGISEALLTTAFGLIVAIPAVVCYHIFRGKAENLLRMMEDAALDILSALRHAARNGAGK